MESKLEIITRQIKALSKKTERLAKLMEESETGVASWWQAIDSMIEEIKNEWMEIEL